MTLVAGSLFTDGVALAADCRLTYYQSPGKQFVVDDAQKILTLGPRTLIGFSGDLRTVAYLFGHLYGPQLERRRLDGMSVRRWLPRFLRATYAALRHTYPMQVRGCSFLVASTIPERTHRLRIRDVMGFVSATSKLGQNNHLCLRILNDINNPSGFVEIPDSSYGLLYELHSPEFRPRVYRPMEYCAIGSGADDAVEWLHKYAPVMFCDSPTLAVGWFTAAIAAALANTKVDSVGRLFTVAAGACGKLSAVLASHTEPGKGAEMVIENGRFVQVDRQSGRMLALSIALLTA